MWIMRRSLWVRTAIWAAPLLSWISCQGINPISPTFSCLSTTIFVTNTLDMTSPCTFGKLQNVTEYCINVHNTGPSWIEPNNSATVWFDITINDMQNVAAVFKLSVAAFRLCPPTGVVSCFNLFNICCCCCWQFWSNALGRSSQAKPGILWQRIHHRRSINLKTSFGPCFTLL